MNSQIMKPKVAVFVLCSTERTGWINPHLFVSLMRLRKDPRLDIRVEMMMDKRPVEHARNLCMVSGRESGVDVCVQIDNDMTLPHNFAEILHEAFMTGKAVVSLQYGILYDEGPKIIPSADGIAEGQFRQTGCAGGGVLIISSEVWRVIPRGPWFRWLANNDEVLSLHTGEDYYFCNLVQGQGLTIWTHNCEAGHLKTIDATRLVTRIMYLQNRIATEDGSLPPKDCIY